MNPCCAADEQGASLAANHNWPDCNFLELPTPASTASYIQPSTPISPNSSSFEVKTANNHRKPSSLVHQLNEQIWNALTVDGARRTKPQRNPTRSLQP